MKKLLPTLLAALALCPRPDTVAQSAPGRQTPVITAAPKAPMAVDSSWRSPKNKRRPARRRTEFIILHTTEGGVIGALEKLSQNGECHYVVDTNGKIYTIIDKNRIAYHAGLSMWDGQKSLDNISVGIEIVGYHDKDLTARQYDALRQLLRELKATYKVPDEKVLTHSMVAYGNPNRWQKLAHRGRKRCAMLLGTNAVRARLGLYAKPEHDPVIRAKRLADADPELTKILYSGPAKISQPPLVKPTGANTASTPPPVIKPPSAGSNIIGPTRSAWDIARDLYAAKTTIYTFPDGTKKRGDEINDWKREMQPGVIVDVGQTRIGEENENAAEGLVTIGIDGSARELAGADANAATTFYFKPDTKNAFKTGSSLSDKEIETLPQGTKMLIGYKRGGPVSSKLPVFNICGLKWKLPTTYHLDPTGKITPGDKVDEKNIKPGTFVFFKP